MLRLCKRVWVCALPSICVGSGKISIAICDFVLGGSTFRDSQRDTCQSCQFYYVACTIEEKFESNQNQFKPNQTANHYIDWLKFWAKAYLIWCRCSRRRQNNSKINWFNVYISMHTVIVENRIGKSLTPQSAFCSFLLGA